MGDQFRTGTQSDLSTIRRTEQSGRLGQLVEALQRLDGYFHEPGRDHVHRKPLISEMLTINGLRGEVVSMIGELGGNPANAQSIHSSLENCCGTTLEFINTCRL